MEPINHCQNDLSSFSFPTEKDMRPKAITFIAMQYHPTLDFLPYNANYHVRQIQTENMSEVFLAWI